jgi:pimeloyl-ACP methyl ester carboxylesterase
MNYTEKYHQLKSHFIQGVNTTSFPDSDISCYWTSFESRNISTLAEEQDHYSHHSSVVSTIPDDSISENLSFRYPVFKSLNASKNRQAIILLHGLNERSWNKYLVWAQYLASHTGRPVILFPIAFHMNRSPEAWGNPRAMASLLLSRKQRFGDVPMATFANVALSERLCEDPLRFFTSGQQSAADLVQLTQQLNRGEHPLFEKGTSVDLFAYSIGAFLAQILMLGNPEGLFTDSKLFLFCGGAFFDEMDGESKLIMDQKAFERLRQFYCTELNTAMDHSDLLRNSLTQSVIGQSFQAMLSEGTLKTFRENMFRNLRKQIQAVALLRDKVIPAEGIAKALQRFIPVEVMDFAHFYSHENPFPILSGADSTLVDLSFEKVFSRAAAFLL